MEMNQTNQQTNIDYNKYLVTQKSDISSFSQEKLQSDLAAIEKAEIRSKQRVDIARDKEENQVSRAIDALSLNNPFKGF
jgi:hypothetical protein